MAAPAAAPLASLSPLTSSAPADAVVAAVGQLLSQQEEQERLLQLLNQRKSDHMLFIQVQIEAVLERLHQSQLLYVEQQEMILSQQRDIDRLHDGGAPGWPLATSPLPEAVSSRPSAQGGDDEASRSTTGPAGDEAAAESVVSVEAQEQEQEQEQGQEQEQEQEQENGFPSELGEAELLQLLQGLAAVPQQLMEQLQQQQSEHEKAMSEISGMVMQMASEIADLSGSGPPAT